MKKNIIIFISLFLFQSVCLYAEFKYIISGSQQMYDFYRVNDKLITTNYGVMIVKDLNTDKIQYYSSFSTDLPLELKFFLSKSTNLENSIPEYIWVYGNQRFIKISDLISNPIPTQVVSIEEIDGMNTDYYHHNDTNSSDSTDYLNGVVQEDLNSNNVYIITRNKLLKVNLDKPDSLLLEVPYSTAADDWKFCQISSNHRNLVYNSQDTLLWFTNYWRNQIGQYNINTNLLRVFDYTQIPVSKDFKILNYFIMPDSSMGINNIVFFVTDDNEFKLLIYNSITKDWEIEEMGCPSNSTIYTNQSAVNSSFLWPFNNNEIAVSFRCENAPSLCIYSRISKQWRDFMVPLHFFLDEDGSQIDGWRKTLLSPLKIDWFERNKSIGILYDHCLIEYIPTSSTDNISTEEGIFQEIGIRNIYPNPITKSSTVDIMCYVQDLSKIDIGLYDVLGTKILDLNNNYEYNSTTYTITTTIEVPIGTPSGTYYLNVHNGSEFKTRAVIINK